MFESISHETAQHRRITEDDLSESPRIVLGAGQRDVWLGAGSGKVLGVN